MLQTMAPREGARVLLLVNGAYGRRMEQMCEIAGLECEVVAGSETAPVSPVRVEAALTAGPRYTAVTLVHCETSSGVMNDVTAIGQLVR